MLTRIRVRPHKGGVSVMGFAPAAKGSEKVVGYFVCKLGDLASSLADPACQVAIGLDKQPKRRTRTVIDDLP